MSNKEILSLFKVGDIITIVKRPQYWNSFIICEYPFDSVKFPYTMKIKQISLSSYNIVSMTEGIYGWSLTSIVNESCVDIKKIIRNKKLKKLKNESKKH